jgi:serine palmitoyltransferase
MSELKDIPFGAALSTYFSWTVLFLAGHIRDFLAALLWGWSHNEEQMGTKPGYAPLRQDYEDFYTRRAYYRVMECFSRPVAGPPDRVINVVMRRPRDLSSPVPTGEERPCINLGSYNYLGFASQVLSRPCVAVLRS